MEDDKPEIRWMRALTLLIPRLTMRPFNYMINCAHPDHMLQMISAVGNRVSRFGGIRVNAASLSYDELDVTEELDIGDPDEFGLNPE
jgi:S-methylmethionine-dependent homocysteine/selenocysteine methylase